MIFYHGSNVAIEKIDLTKSNLRTDFGRGFYLADKLDMVRKRAIDTAGVLDTPVVTEFEVDIDGLKAAGLTYIRFNDMTLEWIRFVRLNSMRKSKDTELLPEPRHNYDVVSGPIADDAVAEVMRRYCKGELSDEEALKLAGAFPNVFQLSLHTEPSLDFAKATRYQQRKAGKWSAWINL